MFKNYYQNAVIIYTIQLFLLSVLVPSNLAAEAGIFPLTSLLVQKILCIAILALAIFSIFLIRQVYISGLRSQRYRWEMQRIENLEEQNSIFRQHRHDLYNHLTVISGLAQLGKLENLKTYLDSYLHNFNASIINVSTGIKELDILLYAKISRAKSLGIDVDYCWEETVQCSHDQTISLIALLANALDNAIEASSQAGESKSLGIRIHGDLVDYIFEVWNTYDSSLDLAKDLQIEGYTAKPDSPRGEGLSIMRRITKSLHGNLDFFVGEGVCKMVVEIPKVALGGRT